MLPSTVQRVVSHTAPQTNAEIRRQTADNVARFAERSPEQISRRLRELDEEWDIERALEANAAGVAILGAALALHNRRFLVIPGLVGTFLLQHALQGWCPPLPIFRRLGFRTASEIDQERLALRIFAAILNGLRNPGWIAAFVFSNLSKRGEGFDLALPEFLQNLQLADAETRTLMGTAFASLPLTNGPSS